MFLGLFKYCRQCYVDLVLEAGFEQPEQIWSRRRRIHSGSLRLVEGTTSCASSDHISLTRYFTSTTPAHEFGHILGLKDAYQVFYDPHARTFVEVQNRATLMGSHTAPASMGNYIAACRNLLQRKN